MAVITSVNDLMNVGWWSLFLGILFSSYNLYLGYRQSLVANKMDLLIEEVRDIKNNSLELLIKLKNDEVRK